VSVPEWETPLPGSASDRRAHGVAHEGGDPGTSAVVSRHLLNQRGRTNRPVNACFRKWWGAELALDVARRCFEG
jgi:hypothetical protein